MKYLAQLTIAIAFAFTIFSLPVYGDYIKLEAHGRSGGTDFSVGCGDGKVLIGLRGYKGLWLDRLQGKCRKISTDGRWLGSTTYTDLADGGIAGGPQPPAQPIDITCPANTAVKGMSGRYDSEKYVTKLNLRCEGLGAANTTATTISVTAPYTNVDNDTSWSMDTCPDNKPGRGVHGRNDDRGPRSVGLTCHSGSTPDMEILAAPDGLAAVNLVNATGPPTTAVTPFVQLSWVDQSTHESGFRVLIGPQSATFVTHTFDRPAGSGIGSRQAFNLIDLPAGNYNFNVCSKYSTADGGDLCLSTVVPFSIGQASTAPTCSPTITSVERIGSGTARVRWSHTCTNPNNFTIRVRSGSNAEGTVASTLNGTVREETFNFVVGTSSAVRVCAIFPGQGATAFCSAERSFQFNLP